MERHLSNAPSMTPLRRHVHWLACAHSRPLGETSDGELIGDSDAPEIPMTIVFEGLTEDEQRAALAGFPGGIRFTLAR